MMAEGYLRLINAGWRRSGTFLYRPVAGVTCCKLQAIRFKARELVASKSAHKAAKKFFRHFKVDLEKCEDRMRHLDEGVRELGRSGDFSLRLRPATPNREAYNLFAAYQREIHGEVPNEGAYRSFLCVSPLSSG